MRVLSAVALLFPLCVSVAQAAEPAVEAKIASWGDIEAAVKGHKGHVVVMDLWTTYCPPCRKEFPNLVSLHNRLGKQVKCMSVSLDFDNLDPVETCREEVLKFLQEQKATCENYVCSTAAEDVFGKKIKHQSVPAIYVFDKQGKLAAQFPDPKAADPEDFSYEKNIVPLVEKLIAQ